MDTSVEAFRKYFDYCRVFLGFFNSISIKSRIYTVFIFKCRIAIERLWFLRSYLSSIGEKVKFCMQNMLVFLENQRGFCNHAALHAGFLNSTMNRIEDDVYQEDWHLNPNELVNQFR